MAQPIACDICTTSPAVQMLTNLQDGTVLAICAACLPDFYGHSLLVVMDAGQHKGPAGKCQACRRVHERMTTPTAPAGDVPQGTPPADDGWSGNKSAGALGPDHIRQIEEAGQAGAGQAAGDQ